MCILCLSDLAAYAARREMPAKVTIGVTATVVGDADVFNLNDCSLPDRPPECCVGDQCLEEPAESFSNEERLRLAREALKPEVSDPGG